MKTWWNGTRLVLGRTLLEHVRSKTFKVVMALLLLSAIAAVTLPQLLGSSRASYTLVTIGPAPTELRAALDAAAGGASVQVSYAQRQDEADLVDAVRAGEATAGLTTTRLYVAERNAGIFPALVAQAAVRDESSRLLADFGLGPAQISRLQSVRPPEQVAVGAAKDTSRAGVGFGVGLVLYLALMFSGTVISTAVATEKSTRISEVLLAVLRPSQILVGTVLAVGVVSVVEILVLGVPVAVAAKVTNASWLPSIAALDIVLALVWFVLGFMLFAFLYAAGGALVDKVTDAGTAVMPVTTLIIAGYMLGIVLATSSAGAGWGTLVSMFPLTAPLTMPIRWAGGSVPVWQLIVAMGLTAATAVAFVGLASMIYRRALVITGRRVKVRELFGRAGHS